MAITKKRHYYVIVGSTLGHIALLLAFANISLDKVAQEFKNSDESERRNSPARVSMEQLPFEEAAPVALPPAQPLEESVPFEAQVPDTQALEVGAPINNQTNSMAQLRPIAAHDNELSSNGDERSSQQSAPLNDRRKGDGKPVVKKKKRKISGAAFMSAFQNSRALSNEIESNSGNNRYGKTGSTNGTIPAHVQERLAIWRDLNFREKIRYALLKQACSTRKIVYGPIKISFSTIIDIDSKGRLITMPHVNTGSQDVNEYLSEMLKNADFPPIPQRLNRADWQEPFSFELNLQAGHNTSELYLSQGANPNPPLRIY